MTKKRGSSKGWLKEHRDDYYVQRAQADGYRSRACYKLLELNEKDRFIRPGMTIVDLGSAPGGWSQVAAQRVGHKGRVIASDILPMDAIAGVDFIQGDFTEQSVFDEIQGVIGADHPSVVLSDMAPNMSGIVDVDQPKAMYLVELALDLAVKILPKGGVFVAKVFHGEGFDNWLKLVRTNFQSVNSRKPAASRPRSKEVYVVAKGFKFETQLGKFPVNA
ncbi:MAG: 23S rRNA (uridine(2552)-2'-O)-methyltransferase RlmE [Pseudomonadota bacterium]|nr:23S rRNA (uridine(2552)-2'-O)-methyltransferase RlmE [Pseudomonadota bacterium]